MPEKSEKFFLQMEKVIFFEKVLCSVFIFTSRFVRKFAIIAIFM